MNMSLLRPVSLINYLPAVSGINTGTFSIVSFPTNRYSGLEFFVCYQQCKKKACTALTYGWAVAENLNAE